MRIRKISQVSGFVGTISNSYSSSNVDTYSCSYVNGKVEKFGKLLWSGTFTSGNITVDGLSDYTLIAVDVAGCICFGNSNFGGGSVGAYGSYGATEYTYRFNPNGDTLTIDNNNRGGSNGTSNQAVRKIWGLF